MLREEDEHPASRTRLAGVFAPDSEIHTKRLDQLKGTGVRHHESFEALLEDPAIDAIWLPVPIHLHREMATAVLQAGKPLMLEKPVAGCVQDHLAIARLQEQSQVPVLIGFQDIYAPGTAWLKRRLLSGELGQPLHAVVHGCWPRPDAYYQRNSWAGALSRDGIAVHDSPLSNAMAHFVNLAMFLVGSSFTDTARILRVHSELWRARPIESFDTCSLRLGLEGASGPIDLVVLLTHATSRLIDPVVEIDTDRGTLRWTLDGRATFRRTGEATASEIVPPAVPRPHMFRRFGSYVCDGPSTNGAESGAVATLTNSLSHTLLFEATHRAAPIVDVPTDLQDVPEDPRQLPRSVRGLAAAIEAAAASRQTLVEHGIDLPASPGTVEQVEELLITSRTESEPSPQH